MGISHGIHQGRVNAIEFDIGMFTNLAGPSRLSRRHGELRSHEKRFRRTAG